MDASFHIRPFAFDRVFAVAAAADQSLRYEDLLVQLATLETEAARAKADRDAAVKLARAEAFEAGLSHARAETGAAMLGAIDALQASIEQIDVNLSDVARDMTADATQVALAAADLLAARALGLAPAAAIDEAIGRVLKQVARGQDLQVRVHPDLVEDITRVIAVRQGSERRQLNLHVAADPMVALGDACIEWDGGGLSLDAATRREAVHAELASLLQA